MKVKYFFISIVLIIILFGCGITSRETSSENIPKNSTKIYAVTDKGISVSNSNGAKWDNTIQKSKTNNLPSSTINDLLLTSDKFYLATDRGLAVSTDNMQSFEVYNDKNKINSVQVNGLAVAIATEHGCYLATANCVFNRISPADSFMKAVYQGDRIYAAQKNVIKICTENIFSWEDLYTFPGELKDFIVLGDTIFAITNDSFFVNDQLLKNFDYSVCSALFLDSQNVLWLSTDKGLYKSSDRGKSWVVYDKTSGLEETKINCIFVDNLNIYLATDNGLIHSVNAGETWKTYKRNNGLISNKIIKIIAKK